MNTNLDKRVAAGETLVIAETTAFFRLVLEEGGAITAPEGKLLSLTVGGVEQPIRPGAYSDATLTVTEDIPCPVDGFDNTGYRMAIYGDETGVHPENSVLSAFSGTVDDTSIRGGSIRSESDFFSGILLKGGTYTLSDVDIALTGCGGNDFSGLGAAITAVGAQVEVDHAKIETFGAIRGAVLAADGADLKVRNSTIYAHGCPDGELPDVQRRVGSRTRMVEVPWALGLSGNNRATNAVGNGNVLYENCSVRAERWGVLSTDGVDSPKTYGEFMLNLTARNTDVEITGESGYGSYSIGACHNVFDGCRFRVPDFALIIANEYASGDFINGTTVHSGRFGVMIRENQGGKLTVRDAAFYTKRSTFLIKGCYPILEVERSTLAPENGVILEMIDTDDPGLERTEMPVDEAVPTPFASHDPTALNYHDCRIFGMERTGVCTDLQAVFRDAELQGDFFNGTVNGCPCGMDMPMPDPDGAAPMPPAPGEDGQMPPMPPMKPSTEYPVNLDLTLENVRLTGRISASTARHAIPVIAPKDRIELGQVRQTPTPAVNNGVLVTLRGGSVWTVTGECYLTALTLEPGAAIVPAAGKSLAITLDGAPLEIVPGETYRGSITISLRDNP